MPEDNSDDSSIPDCCRSKQAAIRNKALLCVEYQRNRLWNDVQTDDMRFVLTNVHFSRFAKILTGKPAIFAGAFSCRFSDRQIGLQRGILLFFTSLCRPSARKSAAYVAGGMPDVKENEHIWSTGRDSLRCNRAALGLFGLRPVFGFGLVRVRSSQQLFHRFLQQ